VETPQPAVRRCDPGVPAPAVTAQGR